MPAADPLFDLDRASAALTEAVIAAGDIAKRFFANGAKTWTKNFGHSPVTEADLAVDAFLRERLSLLAPDYGWLSEETRDSPDRLSRRRLWIVDPIDGTRAFVAGGTDWSISAALVEDGRSIVAALHAPLLEQTFVARRGGGATRNGVPIRAGNRAAPAGARMAGPKQGEGAVARLLEEAAAVERVRSLALRIARVGEGTLDVAFAGPGGHDWDLAAAELIVREAGGLLTTRTGAELMFNRPRPVHDALVAAGAGLHRVVIERLNGKPPVPAPRLP